MPSYQKFNDLSIQFDTLIEQYRQAAKVDSIEKLPNKERLSQVHFLQTTQELLKNDKVLSNAQKSAIFTGAMTLAMYQIQHNYYKKSNVVSSFLYSGEESKGGLKQLLKDDANAPLPIQSTEDTKIKFTKSKNLAKSVNLDAEIQPNASLQQAITGFKHFYESQRYNVEKDGTFQLKEVNPYLESDSLIKTFGDMNTQVQRATLHLNAFVDFTPQKSNVKTRFQGYEHSLFGAINAHRSDGKHTFNLNHVSKRDIHEPLSAEKSYSSRFDAENKLPESHFKGESKGLEQFYLGLPEKGSTQPMQKESDAQKVKEYAGLYTLFNEGKDPGVKGFDTKDTLENLYPQKDESISKVKIS
jgi:Substrate of the Dot/Icm secretion system, putative